MYLLNENNNPISIDYISNNTDNRYNYCILDYEDPNNSDFYFIPLLYLDTFNTSSACIKINNKILTLPLDWFILIGEPEIGDLEFIRLDHCIDKDFKCLNLNPIKSYRPKYSTLEIIDIYPDIKWYTPKLKNGHILALPIENKENPECIFITKELTKIADVIDLSKIL